MAELTKDDLDQIAALRATATQEETARFAAELYKLRNTPSSNFFASFPKVVIILIAIWFGLLETADKLPQLLLSYPRYEAALAEVQAKILQPDLLKAQIVKAENEADASKLQPDMTKTQLEKSRFDVTVSRFAADAAPSQPAMVTAQLEKARNDASASAYQPDAAKFALAKGKSEAETAAIQPDFTKLQMAKLGIDTKVAFATLPTNLQAAGLSNNLMSIFAPFMQGLVGGFQQQPSSQEQAPIAGQHAPAPRAPVTGSAVFTTDRFLTLAHAADAASNQHNCAEMVRIYNEGMPIIKAATSKTPNLTAEQRNQAMKIASLRIEINDPQSCPGQSVP